VVVAPDVQAQAPSSAASAASSAADAADAKRRFTQGLKLYAERAYAEALVEFQKSYSLGHRASALRNVAQCHRDLRHFADAYEAYTQLLMLHGPQLSQKDRDAVTHALEELADLSGAVAVVSSQPGASVEIDGQALGTTPLASPKRLSLGPHRVVVTKAGFEPFEKIVTVESGASATVEAVLSTETGSAHVTVREHAGGKVDVFIDGKDVGPAPWEGDLPPGDHTLEARGPHLQADPRPFGLARRQRLDMVVDAATTTGHLRVTTIPSSARIHVDGTDVGSGVWDDDLAPGRHRVEVTAGGQSSERELTLVRGQLLVVDIPVGGASAGGYQPEYDGVYVKLGFEGLLSPGATNLFDSSQGQPGMHVAAAAALRIGYAFDIWGVELAAAGMIDHYGESLGSGSSAPSYSVTSGDAFVGAGARVTSRDATTRFTFGIDPGVAIHAIGVNSNGNTTSASCGQAQSLNPCTGSGQSGGSLGAGYAGPGVLLDGGMLVGNTPGAKFYLGVGAWLDLAPTLYAGPDSNASVPAASYFPSRSLKIVSGPQFYIGPTLGLQFGH
jgi:hypothetical protein